VFVIAMENHNSGRSPTPRRTLSRSS
jgi:hypothetical protein